MATRGTSPAGGAPRGTARHVPVLLPQMLQALAPKDGCSYIDGTFGAGGYSEAILAAAPGARVLGIDRDPAALAAGRAIVDRNQGRLHLIEGRFGDLDRVAAAAGFAPADGVVLDIGVSSMQLDDPARGFSFQGDGPLDMRMAASGPTAADVINTAEEAQLADILFHLGEERSARGIARAIVARRQQQPFTRTSELAQLVARVLGREKIAGRHAATRTFQALRIYVNDELCELATRPRGGRAHPRTRWASRRRHLPLAGGPAGQALPQGPCGAGGAGLAPSAAADRRPPGTEFPVP